MSHRKDTDYLSISARIHAMETRMLTKERMERMIDAKDNSEVVKVLEECGYGEPSGMDKRSLEEMLARARETAFREIGGAAPDRGLTAVFQLRYDYHNAKVLVKAQLRGTDPGPLLLSGGRYDPEKLLAGWERDELSECSQTYRFAIQEARQVLADTKDAQQADLVLDRACYAEMDQLARETGSSFLQGYVRLVIDSTNLRTAVRCGRQAQDSEFVLSVLLPGGNVSPRTIAATKVEDLGELFQSGPLAAAAAMGAKMLQPDAGSLTRFEGACDDAVTAYMSQAKRIPFGEQTVIGYLYAKELELTAVRIILSGRMAGLDRGTIRSRLRATYV